jgi:hypothetical protein
VTCELDDDTTYAAGSGIELNGGSISLKTTCTAGQLLKWDGADWTCAGDVDTNTTYTAGSGLTLTGTTFAADTSVLQSRVVGTCPGGSAIKAIDASGNVTCEPMTTYAAGSGLELDGTTFSLTKSCLPGEVLKWSGTTWVCAVMPAAGSVSSASGILAPGAFLTMATDPNKPAMAQAWYRGGDGGWYQPALFTTQAIKST